MDCFSVLMHKTLAEPVEALVLCIGEAEITYTLTSSVTVISALCNCCIMSLFFYVKNVLDFNRTFGALNSPKGNDYA